MKTKTEDIQTKITIMKKTIISMCALLAATSCTNEVDMFQTIGTGRATIDLSVSNNDNISVVTRAENTVSDLAAWTAVVTTNGTSAAATAADKVGELTFKANDKVTVKVSNYADLATAMAAELGAGAAYYEGTSEEKTLVKGANAMTVACGKAQNCRVKATWTNTENLITINSIVAAQSDKSRTYTFSKSEQTAYYYAGTAITYTVNYTYNSESKTVTGTLIEAPVAATEYGISITSNDNGKITLTITYDDDFSAGENKEIVIDAATGAEETE